MEGGRKYRGDFPVQICGSINKFNNEQFSGEAFSAVACSQIRYFDHFWIALVNGDSKLACKWVSV